MSQANSTASATNEQGTGMKDSLANVNHLTPEKATTTGTPPTTASSGETALEETANGEEEEKAKPSKSPKLKKSKKTYLIMIHEAIVALKDRSGSSQIAISKYVLANNNLSDISPNQYKSHLNKALKGGVKSGRFAKIKNSFKINSEWTKKEKAKQRAKEAMRKKKEKLRRMEESKAKQEAKERAFEEEKAAQLKLLEEAMTEEERDAIRKKMETELAAKERKLQAERLKREIAERLKKRRFPMEDLALINEDKELGVKPPSHVKKRPALPWFFSCTTPLDQRTGNSKTASAIMTASKSEGVEFGNRGLVADMMQVFHFFQGDVSYNKLCPTVEFGMRHLIFAVDEVLNGNAKKSRMVPPLISHLFCVALTILLDNTDSGSLHRDLSQLQSGLGSASWSEICFLYMDAMERYHTTNASVDANVLPGRTVDIQYLMQVKDFVKEEPTPQLPLGYCAYIGDPRSTLARAYTKLETKDAWNLTAEELMALLRALTDDVLGMRQDLCDEIASREEEMYELTKAKRTADSQFRKIRLAYEGPKNPPKKKTDDNNKASSPNNGEKSQSKSDDNKASSPKKGETENGGDNAATKFKPTASKKQFESARKAQQKATDAYEKGLKKLVARREPIGYDRNHNAIYFFNHDPEMLYVEILKPAASNHANLPDDMQSKRANWHVIETKSLLDQYAESLDIRGTREHSLYEALLGPVGGSGSVRRFLFDDIKEQSDKVSMQKQMEELERRLSNARIACAEEEEDGGRRSGRLASRAQIDLAEVEDEIAALEKRIQASETPTTIDYEEATGLAALRKFDHVGRRPMRRSREVREESNAIQVVPVTTLVSTGNIDGTGMVGSIVAKMLDLEELCQSLAPVDNDERRTWISSLEDLVHAWNVGSQSLLGPQGKGAGDDMSVASAGTKRSVPDSPDTSQPGEKRRKAENGSISATNVAPQSIPQIIASLKPLLLDLEERVLEMIGFAATTRDADLADDNMSVATNEEEEKGEGREQLAWKKKINSLNSIPTHRYGQIRELLVEAIAAARKAHLSSVVAELRSALLLHHPNAAGNCKAEALATLQRHGGYQPPDDEDEDDEESDEEEEEDDEIPSILSGEAMMINGSLKGDENANRVDWVDAVKSCKTIARFAALAFAFVARATESLKKNEREQNVLYRALAVWEKEEQKRTRGGKAGNRTSKTSVDAMTEVWANVEYTDELCMAKLETFPPWPSKRCKAKDPKLANSLRLARREIVSLVGEEGGLRVVKIEDILPYTGKAVKEDVEYTKEIRTQLDDCLAMARRIVRGQSKK